MEKKGKRIESENGEIQLPEAMIQHVQSYLNRKEAARTTILSKSWYAAWLTRPVLDLDYRDFRRDSLLPVFEEYAKKTMQRYQGSSLKIERFRLRVDEGCSWAHDLIINAMNIGATDVQIEFHSSDCILPKEVLGSQTLHRLSVSGNGIQTLLRFNDGSLARCSSLQSLSLDHVYITSADGFKDIISCCGSMDELSLSYIFDDTFFTDFASRFPCLKDLTILDCDGYTRIAIASTSLQTICFTAMGRPRAKFDVPSICKFTYYGSLPHLSIKGGLTEWELVISIERNHFPKNSWFLKLKKLLTKIRLSRISLCLMLDYVCKKIGRSERDLDIEVVRKPLVLENLTIDAPFPLCCALLLRLFGISRPKFITSMFYSRSDAHASFTILCNRLMKKPVTPNCGIPDQDMFGKFGLKKVNMEVYEKVDANWLPLMLEKPLDPSKTPVKSQKIRFELIWD